VNGEGEYSSVAESYAYLRGEFVTGYDFGGSQGIGGYYPDISLGFAASFPSSFYDLPPILPRAARGEDEFDDSATPRPDALPPEMVDPEEGPFSTVFEGASAPTATRTRETDWDWVYDQYVILNPVPPVIEPTIVLPEEDVPFHSTIIDWGVDVASAVAGGIFDPVGLGAAVQSRFAPSWLTTPGVTGIPSLGQQQTIPAPTPVTAGATMEHGCPPYGPKYGKICLATGAITPLRRRRRRRLLTSSDIKDLSALKSIVGGAALQAAVTQAVRR